MTSSLAWIPLTLTIVAMIHDLRTREVPDWISAAVFVGAVMATAVGSASASNWLALMAGTALALVIGLAMFALGAWGGADVKLLTALGAWLGPAGLLATLFWMAIAGGVLSIVYWARGEKTLPYIPAIAAGLLIHIVWPNALSQIVQGSW